ncbi:hypothetical protein RQM47_16350 [Rubrivirga sp. S365]|uniref:hypothetical protein n=1 Tax=Rubrivirga sp. S365 TaxID=3076080 RepID=UPI0028C5F471|nr:hypothetical protein [Rubrivirga sp. S365]MDT7858221.1 hypothetical protein [Rubrivirga sp. S365]
MSALLAAAKPGVPVSCGDCGQRYPQDPPFEVACPDCGARAGSYCRRPSGHSGPFVPFHAARDLAAKDRGFYGHDCVGRAAPAVSQASPPTTQTDLFAGG